MTSLSRRALNRALLQRQFLLERTDLAAAGVIGHLVAMQAQEPNWPYIGLWTRIRRFTHADLTTLLAQGRVVRSGFLPSTMHLAAADDFRRLRPVLQPVLNRTADSAHFRRNNAGLDAEALLAEGRALLQGGPLPRRDLARHLAALHPGRDSRTLAGEIELRTPLIHDAFGPATVADIQAWCGLTRLDEIVSEMRAGLRHYTGPDCQRLLDLPDTPLPDPDTTAPARLLPAYDNVLLGHADRSRIIAEANRKQVAPGQARILPTVLIDGFVRGTWSFTAGEVRLTPFRPLSAAEQQAVDQEISQLLPFLS